MSVCALRSFSKSSFIRASDRLSILRQHVMASTAPVDPSLESEVLVTKLEDKAVLTLNRPRVLNALSINQIRRITSLLRQWKAESSMRFVIIKGAGGKSFCCGGDLVEITKSGKVKGEVARKYMFEEYILDHLTGALGFPWVALIDGITMGAGFGLSVHGQFRVATERTLFAMPETAIGLFPDVGGGYILPRMHGKLGTYLALTGARLKGRDVLHAGIATHFVQSNQLDQLEHDLVALKAATPSDVAAVLQKHHDKCSIEKDKPFSLAPRLDQIDRLFDAPTLEQIFKNLRKDGSDWAQEQLAILNKMSPTSMKVTLRQLQAGAKMTLAQDLNMEYRLAQRCLDDHDLYEGVRAVLIDKDQSPSWKPAKIEDVTEEKLDWYFSPLADPKQELVISE